MCKAISEGGQRCAAHTRSHYLTAQPGTPEWDDAAVNYASTPEGLQKITDDGNAATDHGNYEFAIACESAVERGSALRLANQETASRLGAAKVWTEGEPHPIGSYDHIGYDDAGICMYTRNGTLHRMDGPAVVYPDGETEFYVDGEFFCEYACLKESTAPTHCTRRN